MYKRLSLTLFLLGTMVPLLAHKDDCFAQCAQGTKAALLYPGKLCMNTSLQDCTTCTFGDWPILYSFFNKNGSCFHEWNYLPVTVMLVAGIVYEVKNKYIRKKLSALSAYLKKKK